MILLKCYRICSERFSGSIPTSQLPFFSQTKVNLRKKERRERERKGRKGGSEGGKEEREGQMDGGRERKKGGGKLNARQQQLDRSGS